jgi:hypothetical protein
MDACHLNYIKNLKKKTTKSQEFSYFKNIYKDYPYIWCMNGYRHYINWPPPTPPLKSTVKVYACIIVLKEE